MTNIDMFIIGILTGMAIILIIIAIIESQAHKVKGILLSYKYMEHKQQTPDTYYAELMLYNPSKNKYHRTFVNYPTNKAPKFKPLLNRWVTIGFGDNNILCDIYTFTDKKIHVWDITK